MGLEDEFLLEDADDEKTIEYIKNYLPQELKDKFSDDELYYFLDVMDEYYVESGILDAFFHVVEYPLVGQVLAYLDALETLVNPIVGVAKTLVVHHRLLDAQLWVLQLVDTF